MSASRPFINGRRRLWRWLPIAATAALLLGPATLPAPAAARATTDQADDVSGPQIHFVYAVASDGVDHQLDTNGAVATAVTALESWLAGQAGGRTLRIDTHGGDLDVTFVRLQQTSLAMKQAASPELTESRVFAAGGLHLAQNKLYMVYYDGDFGPNCGGSSGVIGYTSLQSWSGGPCGVLTGGPSPGYTEFVTLFNILVMHGFTAPPGGCGPHVQAGGGVSDSPTDVLYTGPAAWAPSVLDYGHDDYYGQANQACPDFSRSAFLYGGGTELPGLFRPTITTDGADATSGAATFHGGGSAGVWFTPSTLHFQYGTTPSYGSRTPDEQYSGSTVSASVGGLTPNTTYHVRAVLNTPYATAYGDDYAFATPPVTPPTTAPVTPPTTPVTPAVTPPTTPVTPAVTPLTTPPTTRPRPLKHFTTVFGTAARLGAHGPIGRLEGIAQLAGIPAGSRVEVRCVRACAHHLMKKRSWETPSTRLSIAFPIERRTIVAVRVVARTGASRTQRYRFAKTGLGLIAREVES